MTFFFGFVLSFFFSWAVPASLYRHNQCIDVRFQKFSFYTLSPLHFPLLIKLCCRAVSYFTFPYKVVLLRQQKHLRNACERAIVEVCFDWKLLCRWDVIFEVNTLLRTEWKSYWFWSTDSKEQKLKLVIGPHICLHASLCFIYAKTLVLFLDKMNSLWY